MSAGTSALSELVSSVATILQPFCIELSFLVCFALGFYYLRLDAALPSGGKKTKKVEDPAVAQFDHSLRKIIEAETSGRLSSAASVLVAWRAGKDRAPTPPDLLRPVVQALVDQEPDALVAEVCDHLRAHKAVLCNSRNAREILDVVARAGNTAAMATLWKTFNTTFQIPPTSSVYEVLSGGYASVGAEDKVGEVAAEMKRNRMKPTARGLSLTIKGYLKSGMIYPVMNQIVEMKKLGFHVPPYALAQFFRISCEAGRLQEVFEAATAAGLQAPSEAVVLMLEHCAHKNHTDLALRIESAAREAKTPLLVGAFDALLKLHSLSGDLRAIDLFEEMKASGCSISEGLCVGLLARCAESKFLRFADLIVKHVRANATMTIALYSALMKVYAYCGMYDKACDLYDQLREDGLEPDSMMYGCLMKFAVECGRTDLSRDLSEKAPSLDIQNYMSLIRAAGRDNDVDRAFAVLEKLKKSGITLDNAAYNCALDVCAGAGQLDRARDLIKEMRSHSSLDIITFNTLLKGHCNAGDLKGAKKLLIEMKEAGLQPNDVSFNCLINAAVTSRSGNFDEAWEIIDLMEKSGVKVDHYTISIMMKSLKKARNNHDVQRALALLDRTGIEVCSDEILLNTVLETCIRHRENARLKAVVAAYRRSDMRPSVHTYGSLIKACSNLKKVDQCQAFWREMEEVRGMDPNDIVLGCMLDALVCNGMVNDAVVLFNKWKVKVQANTVMYSTIIKGFANSHQAEQAMATWRDMRREGVQTNTVVYNAVIDAQARVGAIGEVSELVETMAKDGCTPDAITLSTVAKGYCVKGELDRAFEVFEDMQKSGMAKDAIIYNTLLDGCTRHGRMDLADRVLKTMEANNIVPSNFTLGILVKLYGRRRQLDKAFEVVRELPRKHKFTVNAQVRTCLMCTCINNNSLERALAVFEELKSEQACDAKAYQSLINGCVRHGHLERAQILVEEACGLGREPSPLPPGQTLPSEAVEQLLRALASRGEMDRVGNPLLEKLRAAKVPVDKKIFSAALNMHNNREGDSRAGGYNAGGRGGRR